MSLCVSRVMTRSWIARARATRSCCAWGAAPAARPAAMAPAAINLNLVSMAPDSDTVGPSRSGAALQGVCYGRLENVSVLDFDQPSADDLQEHRKELVERRLGFYEFDLDR